MEILRFGPGFRRRQPPAGSSGLADQPIWSAPDARVTELAFAPRALMPPQTSPDLGLFVVVSGGGWVHVGDERSVINHGEAVEWPPGVPHGAWTDGSPMRAILVEVADATIDGGQAVVVAGDAPGADRPRATDTRPGRSGTPADPSVDSAARAARGRLAPRVPDPDEHDPSEGEPW